MDPTTGITAADVVNTYPARDLTRVLRVYGEERFASRIAQAIVRERAKAPLTGSARLAELVRDSIPAPARRTGGHPAKRTFQALRIEVNGELAALDAALPEAIDALSLGGRIVVLSYHSLEDRMVKQAFAARARSTAPVDLPIVPRGSGPTLRLLTRGAELPSETEVAANPRAASVKLRAAERVDPDAPAARAMRTSRAVHQSTEPGRQSQSTHQGQSASTQESKSASTQEALSASTQEAQSSSTQQAQSESTDQSQSTDRGQNIRRTYEAPSAVDAPRRPGAWGRQGIQGESETTPEGDSR